MSKFTPKYERGGGKKPHEYRSKILSIVPKRLQITDEHISLNAGVWTLNYKNRLLIEFEGTGSAAIEISSYVTKRLLMSPSRKKFLSATEEIIERAVRSLTEEELGK